jgi:hypothetical protein
MPALSRRPRHPALTMRRAPAQATSALLVRRPPRGKICSKPSLFRRTFWPSGLRWPYFSGSKHCSPRWHCMSCNPSASGLKASVARLDTPRATRTVANNNRIVGPATRRGGRSGGGGPWRTLLRSVAIGVARNRSTDDCTMRSGSETSRAALRLALPRIWAVFPSLRALEFDLPSDNVSVAMKSTNKVTRPYRNRV